MDAAAAALLQRLRHALGLCASDAAWQHRGKWIMARCLIGIDEATLLISFNRGKLSFDETPPPLTPWDFAIRGTSRAWGEFWHQPPAPGWHDLFALSKRGELRLEGNLQPLMANLQYFKDLLASPRNGATQ